MCKTNITCLIAAIYEPIVDYLEMCRWRHVVTHPLDREYNDTMIELWRNAYKVLQYARFSLPKELFASLVVFERDFLFQIFCYCSFARSLAEFGIIERLDSEDVYDLYLEMMDERRIGECLYDPDVLIVRDSAYGMAFEAAVRKEALSSVDFEDSMGIGEVVINRAYECLEQLLGGYREFA